MLLDPRYEEEVSGCTASVAILSATKIYVVCQHQTEIQSSDANSYREMQETLEASWA